MCLLFFCEASRRLWGIIIIKPLVTSFLFLINLKQANKKIHLIIRLQICHKLGLLICHCLKISRKIPYFTDLICGLARLTCRKIRNYGIYFRSTSVCICWMCPYMILLHSGRPNSNQEVNGDVLTNYTLTKLVRKLAVSQKEEK